MWSPEWELTYPSSSFIICVDIELLRLELQNYSGAVVLEILRIYLQEIYDHRPVLEYSELRARLSTCLRTHEKDPRLDLFAPCAFACKEKLAVFNVSSMVLSLIL